jgi:hypothetical protein
MSAERQGTTRLRDIARENRAEPPSRARVDALPPMGGGAFAFDLSGLSLAFSGLDAGLEAAARRRFAAYLCDPAAAPSPLRVSVHADTVDYYVEPERSGAEGYYRLRIVHDPGLIRLVTYSMAGWIDLAARRAGLAFGAGTFDPKDRALENFCRVAVAWTALERGGFLVHGAGIVRGGRAYIFFGRSASGKSTLAAASAEGRVVSDDLTLVLPSGGGLAVAGSPFRGTYAGGEPVVGLHPLAAMFLLTRGERTSVERPGKIRAFAEFVANLPFVNDALGRHPGRLEALEAASASVPILELSYRKGDAFWPEVDRAV